MTNGGTTVDEAQDLMPLGVASTEGLGLSAPKVGDYVLATKYADGDPGDPWALGIYDGKYSPGGGLQDRHLVNEADGTCIRPNGFRRVARIRKDVGRWLLTVAAKQLEQSPPGTVNLWTMLTESAFDLHSDQEA